ncbi:MAG: enoyl-CoA hydratase/isomerase family protein [Candidatus Binatia bacterium]
MPRVVGAHRGARGRRAPAVLYEKIGPIASVSLNRPEVLNAYNVAMRDALFETLQAVRDDPDVRVMLLQGNGRAFCTGGDVREFGRAPSPVVARDVRWRRDVWGLLQSLPVPTIAAVHGYAVGGGFEMALLCDLCIAADDARFSYPETGMGMVPGVAGTQTTARALGVGRALDLILTGRWLSAAEALELGIVIQVVAARRLRPAAVDLARRLCELPATLVARAKRVVHEGLDLSLAEGLALERRLNDQTTTHV